MSRNKVIVATRESQGTQKIWLVLLLVLAFFGVIMTKAIPSSGMMSKFFTGQSPLVLEGEDLDGFHLDDTDLRLNPILSYSCLFYKFLYPEK